MYAGPDRPAFFVVDRAHARRLELIVGRALCAPIRLATRMAGVKPDLLKSDLAFERDPVGCAADQERVRMRVGAPRV